jgi:hypothetical protein
VMVCAGGGVPFCVAVKVSELALTVRLPLNLPPPSDWAVSTPAIQTALAVKAMLVNTILRCFMQRLLPGAGTGALRVRTTNGLPEIYILLCFPMTTGSENPALLCRIGELEECEFPCGDSRHLGFHSAAANCNNINVFNCLATHYGRRLGT